MPGDHQARPEGRGTASPGPLPSTPSQAGAEEPQGKAAGSLSSGPSLKSSHPPIRLGTRGSALALAQARWVAAQISGRHPGLQVELVVIKTSGDKIHDRPLAQVGGKGLFIKEIEEALAAGQVDLAVHSLKDMPALIPPGLMLGAVPPREDCRDVLISERYTSLAQIPAGGRLGTGSLRRRAQLLHLRPDLNIVALRGNVDTRLKKMAALNLDGLILAAAGLNRLGLNQVKRTALPESDLLPAVGQGALGLEVRRRDYRVQELIAFLDDPATRTAVTGERAFLARLEGGCLVPVAAHGRVEGDSLRLTALISDLEGRRFLKHDLKGPVADAAFMGGHLADYLLERGGREILAELEVLDL
jgi:hydroxymethylbilane synthase